MNRFSHRLVVSLVAAIALSFGITGHAQAQTIEISPISIMLLPGQMSTTLFVTNKGSDPSALQVRPFQWVQSGRTDQLIATENLLVSPPITTVAAGRTQIFRLVLRAPAQHNEATYRLLLDQLPPPAIAGTVNISLRFSIPVFAEPATIVAPQMDWRINTGPGGAILVGTNQGSAHVRILNPILTSDSGQHFALDQGQTPYILPGAARDWTIKLGAQLISGSTLHLTATSDAGPVHATVHVFGS